MMLEARRNELETAKIETPRETEKRRNSNERKLGGGSSEIHQQTVSLLERKHSPTTQSQQVHQVHIPVDFMS